MFSTLGLNWGNSLLGFLTIAFIPIVFALWLKGDRLRARSKNASHEFLSKGKGDEEKGDEEKGDEEEKKQDEEKNNDSRNQSDDEKTVTGDGEEDKKASDDDKN